MSRRADPKANATAAPGGGFPARRAGLVLVALLVLGACGSKPPTPGWQMSAHGALDRYVDAFMAGNTRVELAEFNQARSALTRTGDVTLVARAELTRCALRMATLALAPCAGFEPLRVDAPPAERAYADYLEGRLAAADVALLPAPHRAVAAGNPTGANVRAITDPLSRLVAAGVLLQAGRASPEVVQVAVDTAAAQGWRRPLLAWLGVQLRGAEQAGATEEAQRLKRRIALVAGES